MSTAVRITDGVLADGRAIRWYDRPGAPARDGDHDRRDLPPRPAGHRMRHDPGLDEWVSISAHRQDRTFLPADDACPLCPSHGDYLTEVPSPDYEVVVFDNRFPSFAGPVDLADDAGAGAADALLHEAAAGGRCEVVCFTDAHDTLQADLDNDRLDLVIAALADRTRELSGVLGVRQVFPFENSGEAIGVTLRHPHGQVYGYPFVTPRLARAVDVARAHRARTGRVLADDVVAAELADGSRVVHADEHWVAFVPYAARYPVEVHLYPRRRVPDLAALDSEARDALPRVYGALLRAGHAFYGIALPSIVAWHQAPVREDDGRDEVALHLELTSVQRAPDKLKYLAGSESAMGAFINDRAPEQTAERLREVWPG